MISLCDHAIDRYHERVKPALTRDAAEAELRALLRVAEIRTELPPWKGLHPDAPTHEDVVAWAYLTDTIALPLVAFGRGYRARTVLTAGGISDEARTARNNARRKRRRYLAHVRQGERSRRQNGRRIVEV